MLKTLITNQYVRRVQAISMNTYQGICDDMINWRALKDKRELEQIKGKYDDSDTTKMAKVFRNRQKLRNGRIGKLCAKYQREINEKRRKRIKYT